MVASLETPVLPLEYSDVQYITVEDLKENFQSGVMTYCPAEIYVRRKPLSDAQIDKKKGYLVSDVDGEKVVQIREPLTFFSTVADGDFGDNLKLLNGNNRVRCEFLLLITNPQYTFLPIPYRVITSTPTISQLIECQDSVNDSGDKHTVLDRSFKIVAEQQRLNEKYKDLGLNKNALKKKITEEIKFNLHTDDATISNAAKLVNLPEFVLNLIDDEKLASTTAVSITRVLEKIKDVTIGEAWQNFVDYCKKTENGLYESSAKVYLASIQPENDNKGSDNKDPDAEDNKKVPKEKLTLEPVTAEQFTQNIQGMLSTFYVIEPEHIKPEHYEGVNNAVKTSLSALVKLQDVLSPSDALEVLTIVKDLVNKVAGNPNHLIERASSSETPLAEVQNMFSKMSKTVTTLYNDIYNPKPVEPAAEKPAGGKKKKKAEETPQEPATAEVSEVDLGEDKEPVDFF